MSNVQHRRTDSDACPIDEAPVTMEKCRPCRFFRGAMHPPAAPARQWEVSCNWPVNGSEVATVAIPSAFTKAFGGS